MSNVIELHAFAPPGNELCDGWHWLQRRSDGVYRLGFYNRLGGWRISDAIGRTWLAGPAAVARDYQYIAALPLPHFPADLKGEGA